MPRRSSPEQATVRDRLEQRLSALEMAVYLSLHGVEQACGETAAQANALGLAPQALRARLLASDARSRGGLSAQAREEQIALHAQARPWPALRCRAAMYLASSCDRLGLRLESVRWVEASISSDPLGGSPAWHAEALMVAGLFAASPHEADPALMERAIAAVRAVGHPVLLSVTAANFAEVTAEAGSLARASHYADEAEATMRRHPECAAALTWESVARARLAHGELSAAQQAMRESLRIEAELGCCDVNGDPWLTGAEVLLACDDPAAALAMLDHPRRRQRHGTSSWTATRELHLHARALAAQGHWEQAYRRMEAYVAAYQQARSLAGDLAAAETVAAVTVDDARREARHFEQLAMTDPLTGLPNRRHAERWLAERSSQDGGWLCVAIADLDHFKRINDGHSHDAGDTVLRRFGTLLQDSLTGADMLAARLGGEEFLLVHAGSTPAAAREHCEAVAARLRGLSFADVLGGDRVTVSISQAHAPRPAQAAVLLRAADEALYEAKRAGRDRVVAVQPG